VGDEKLAESRFPESGGEKEVRKTEIATGIALPDLERVREEWRKISTDRRNLRLLTESVVRRRKNTMETDIVNRSSLTTVIP